MKTKMIAMTAYHRPELHWLLIADGYQHEHWDAFWQETGDPENGPGGLVGNPDMDVYWKGDRVVYVTAKTATWDIEPDLPPEMEEELDEEYLAAMGEGPGL